MDDTIPRLRNGGNLTRVTQYGGTTHGLRNEGALHPDYVKGRGVSIPSYVTGARIIDRIFTTILHTYNVRQTYIANIVRLICKSYTVRLDPLS